MPYRCGLAASRVNPLLPIIKTSSASLYLSLALHRLTECASPKGAFRHVKKSFHDAPKTFITREKLWSHAAGPSPEKQCLSMKNRFYG